MSVPRGLSWFVCLVSASSIANADCWRDQRSGQVWCTNANSTQPTSQHQSGTWVVQQNPYTARAAVNAVQIANDGRKIIVGGAAMYGGSQADATVIGIPLGVTVQQYGVVQATTGAYGLNNHTQQFVQNYRQAQTWQPTQQPYYVPPQTQYQRICRNQRGQQYPC